MKNIDFNDKRVVIRADGSRLIGMGHLVRQLTLARNLKRYGAEVFFCVRDFQEGVSFLDEQGFSVLPISIKDKKDADKLISLSPDILIHDFLETDAGYMDTLKEALPKCFFVGFDDLGNGQVLHHVLFDANRKPPVDDGKDASRKDYTAKRFFGAPYMILREAIARAAKGYKQITDTAKEILVMFGGSDPAGLTLKLVSEWVKDLPDMTFRVVLGPGMRDKQVIETHLADNLVFYENINADKMAELMKGADIAVSSGGISMFELACIGVPSVIIAQNKAETVNMHLFSENGIIIDLGLGSELEKNILIETLRNLSGSAEHRRQMSAAGKKYVDGKGLARITETLADADRYMHR